MITIIYISRLDDLTFKLSYNLVSQADSLLEVSCTEEKYKYQNVSIPINV